MIIFFYETTNTTNGKKYYGIHQTKNINDGYLGSGVILKRAMAKYGKDNFSRRIIKFFNNTEEAYCFEKNFVNEDIVKSTSTYNITIGGKGGFFHIDSSGQNNPMYGRGEFQKEIQSRPEVKKTKSDKMRVINRIRYESGYVNPIKNTNNYWNDKDKAEKAKIKMSENHADVSGSKNPFYGETHSEETKKKLSIKHKNRKKVKCTHCSKIGDVSNMSRWHMENCKHKEL